LGFTTKIIHFRHVSAEILPKSLLNLFIIYSQYFVLILVIRFKYQGDRDGPQGRGAKQFQGGTITPSFLLLSAPKGTVLLHLVNITIECVGVTVKAQAQKVYQ